MKRKTKLLLALSTPVLLAALFAWNGLERSWQVPEAGTTRHPAREPAPSLRFAAFNLAKASFHHGGLSFASTADVRARLDAVAALLRAKEVDVLLLSEVVFEAAPCPVNQVAYLADAAGFHAWVYGDNYSFGWPGLRIRAGNAVLARFPLHGGSVHALTGDAPFWNPTNARRFLLTEVELGDERLLLGSVRTDSFDLENNAAQVRELLALLPARPVVLGGDFNAEPMDLALRLLRASERFLGVFDGPPTFPARHPLRRIDTVLVPTSWGRILAHEVLDVDLSDHEPVLVTVPTPGFRGGEEIGDGAPRRRF